MDSFIDPFADLEGNVAAYTCCGLVIVYFPSSLRHGELDDIIIAVKNLQYTIQYNDMIHFFYGNQYILRFVSYHVSYILKCILQCIYDIQYAI